MPNLAERLRSLRDGFMISAGKKEAVTELVPFYDIVTEVVPGTSNGKPYFLTSRLGKEIPVFDDFVVYDREAGNRRLIEIGSMRHLPIGLKLSRISRKDDQKGNPQAA